MIMDGTYGIGLEKHPAFIITCDVCPPGKEARLIIPKSLKHGTTAEVAWEYHGGLCGWELVFHDETGVREPGHRCRMCSFVPKSRGLLKSRKGK